MHPPSEARREYAQLLRLHDRLKQQLQRVLDDLDTPGTTRLLRDLRRRVGMGPEDGIADVVSSLEEALRALQLAEAEAHAALDRGPEDPEVAGIDNLPGRLARFLAERADEPGFTYTVTQDPIRGWIISWKEHTPDGRIRGYGQFYERPYAWLDD
ncbi:MAG: hypothetical protein P8188_05665 [Gemmatimonadota bacterium]